MDRLSVIGLRARGRHGVYAFEREHGQDFLVDVRLDLDTRDAASTDDLAATVDYGALCDRLVATVAGDPVDLIETLAARLAEVCLAETLVQAVEITVHKPFAPIEHEVADVAVTIRRTRG